jgi:hypothetical protein
MRRRNRIIFGIVVAATLIVILPFLVILPWAASNAFAAGYYLLFTTQPTRQELVGEYNATLNWGTARLVLHADNTFDESLMEKGQEIQTISGAWKSSSGDAGHAAYLTMSPYLEVQEEEHGREYSYSSANFYKPRFGQVYAELNPDLGTRFTKRQH